jgi:DNA-binding transcriptional LysR family regulator
MTAIAPSYQGTRTELRHLRYFVAVAEALNYRKAAQRLHVAQPTLSSQIKDLETDLGVRLLDRNTRGVRLTGAGSVFLTEARLTLTQFSQAVSATREMTGVLRGHMAIAYFAPLLSRFMPPSLKAFNKKFPDIEVLLVEMPLGKQCEAVRSGAVQIGFALRDVSDPPCVLPTVEIVRSPIFAAVSRSHRLARAKQLALADLARERLVCLAGEKGSPREHGEFMRRVFSDRGIKTGPIVEVEGAEPFRAMLESGLGVSLVVGFGSLSQSKKVSLKPLRDTGHDLLVKLLAVWSDLRPSPAIDNFLACMRAETLRDVGRGKHEALQA